MKIIDFYNSLCNKYPSSLSCEWDNDGLMVCTDTDREINKVLVALDATLPCLEYAGEGGFDLVLTHHPLIFKPLKSLSMRDAVEKRVAYALINDITVISLHTRLDAGENGVNDILAKKLGLSSIEPFGDDDCPTLGRIGYTDISDANAFAGIVKNTLGGNVTKYVSRPSHKVALVGGSAIEYSVLAKSLGCDTFITGEGGYNRALDAADDGLNIIIAGHYFTEMPVCETLKGLATNLAGAECEIYDKKAFEEV